MRVPADTLLMLLTETAAPTTARSPAAGDEILDVPAPFSNLSSTPTPPPPALDVAGKHVFLVGIGGCGMSGLARMLKARGGRISGSDMSRQETTDALTADGIAVRIDGAGCAASTTGTEGACATETIPTACDLVVVSAAIKADHPQYNEALRRGIPVLTYAQALGRCMTGRTGVAVAGTHGKSTTTAMLGCVLAAAGIDPTVIVGATCAQLGGGVRIGADTIPIGPLARKPGGGVLVAEACEFNRSFHNFHPTLAVITSVEADHLDIYGSLDAVVESFATFARQVAPADEQAGGGTLLIAHEGAHRREVTAGVRARVQTIGFAPAADWSVRYEPGTRRAELVGPDKKLACSWTMQLPGEHNAMNAATAAALALMLGADAAKVGAALSDFRGVDRRTQFLGVRRLASGTNGAGAAGGQGVRVYDDYGHHPTEIDATLRALRQFERPEAKGGRLVCVFQPHQHSRTRHLLAEFANAFSAADIVIVPHIYFVRDSEQEKQLVSAADLVDRLREKGVRAMHLYPFEAIIDQLAHLCRDGDTLVAMGAGPVYQVAHGFLAAAK